MSSTIIAIDCNNLLCRSYYALRNSNYHNGGVVGLLRSLKDLARNFNSTFFVFCFDSTHYIRQDEYPEYKGKTDRLSDTYKAVRKQLDLLRDKVLPQIGYKNILCASGMEADDLMAFVAERRELRRVVLVSTDSDLYQLLEGEDVVIYDPADKSLRTEEWLQIRHKLTPDEWVKVKAITGCTNDNVKGIRWVGVYRAREHIKGRLAGGFAAKIKAATQLIQRNERLIRLPHVTLKDPIQNLSLDHIQPYQWNRVVSDLKATNLVGMCPV